MIEQSTGVLQESRRWEHLYPNLRAFFSRFLALAWEPRLFAPLVVDFWLLLQSFWGVKQLGPDLVYPMLGIRKRESGRLARLILEHCRAVRRCELRAATLFPKGIYAPSVAVIDLDKAPQDVIKNGYNTQADHYGLTCILMLFETMVAVLVHLFYLFDWGWANAANWYLCALLNMIFCLSAVNLGDGTLILARRSDTSTPGCAVLLDQNFTVILNGNPNIVEAIVENSFIISHPNFVGLSVGRSRLEDYDRDSSYGLLVHDLPEALCEDWPEDLCAVICLTIFMSCFLLLHPTTPLGTTAPLIAVVLIALFNLPPHSRLCARSGLSASLFRLAIWLSPPILFYAIYMRATNAPLIAFLWHLLSPFLFILFLVGQNARNYPIRSKKFLNALGHPPVRKWQFDTLAAAATFQCLVICHGVARPIRTIDVLAFLDMLIPDQRDLWKAWKARVADRIVHEMEISLTPTIPTFGDERQQQLKDLLDQAQFGYDTYRRSYVQHVALNTI